MVEDLVVAGLLIAAVAILDLLVDQGGAASAVARIRGLGEFLLLFLEGCGRARSFWASALTLGEFLIIIDH